MTRRKELLFPDAGIVVWDRRIPPDTRLAGSSPCVIAGVHRDQHLVLDLAALIQGFRARPFATVWRGAGAGIRKPPKEETAERKGAVRARAMGICGWRTARVRRGYSRRRSVLAEPVTADVFARGTARVCRVRGGRVRTGDIAQTSRSCSGAGLEAKAIDGARRDAWRRS